MPRRDKTRNTHQALELAWRPLLETLFRCGQVNQLHAWARPEAVVDMVVAVVLNVAVLTSN
ncbi:hypothetical protein E2C01_050490 [Portunus trituberculatus]|uniref:Uncharacterized protein n=1 Tax=Portunus trituberculatus TaxID=210409 RepID=A0A5B7GHP3_PORTR|nr:hypothetical protein [Portunus trituberculatus]